MMRLRDHSGCKTVTSTTAWCCFSYLFLLKCPASSLFLSGDVGDRKSKILGLSEDKAHLQLKTQEANKWKLKDKVSQGPSKVEGHNPSIKIQISWKELSKTWGGARRSQWWEMHRMGKLGSWKIDPSPHLSQRTPVKRQTPTEIQQPSLPFPVDPTPSWEWWMWRM